MSPLDDGFTFAEQQLKGYRSKIAARAVNSLLLVAAFGFLCFALWVLIAFIFRVVYEGNAPFSRWINYSVFIAFGAVVAVFLLRFGAALMEWNEQSFHVYTVDIKDLVTAGAPEENLAGIVYFEPHVLQYKSSTLEGKSWRRRQNELRHCFEQGLPVEVITGKYTKQIWDIRAKRVADNED